MVLNHVLVQETKEVVQELKWPKTRPSNCQREALATHSSETTLLSVIIYEREGAAEDKLPDFAVPEKLARKAEVNFGSVIQPLHLLRTEPEV